MAKLLTNHYDFGRYILEIIINENNNDEKSIEEFFTRFGIELDRNENDETQRKALLEELKANEKEQRYILRGVNEHDQIIRALHTFELSLKNLYHLNSWISEYETTSVSENDDEFRRRESMFLQSRRNG